MIKILAVTPSDKEINNFWRCSGPLGYLAKHSQGEIDAHIYSYDRHTSGIFWCDLNQVDVLFLHRPSTENDLKAFQIAYLMNVPVWVDWDDWIYDIPANNPSAKYYRDPETRARITHMIQCADVVSVSTADLNGKIAQLNPRTVTLPNAYRSDLFSKFLPESYPEREPTIVWRGTNTHTDDLLTVADYLSDLPQKVTFLGNVAWEIFSKMTPGSYELKGQFDPLLYWHVIYQMKPKVWIVPLADNSFNRAKSNIAWMEALHAGALCVAPDWDEWKKPGCISYTPGAPQSFVEAVQVAHRRPHGVFTDLVKSARDEMLAEYGIKKVNERRSEVVRELVAGTYRSNLDPFKI